MRPGFGTEFGEKSHTYVLCRSKVIIARLFLEHKAIPIGYSGRISSLPTIFCRNPVRETNGIKISQEFWMEKQAASTIETHLNQFLSFCHFFVCSFM